MILIGSSVRGRSGAGVDSRVVLGRWAGFGCCAAETTANSVRSAIKGAIRSRHMGKV